MAHDVMHAQVRDFRFVVVRVFVSVEGVEEVVSLHGQSPRSVTFESWLLFQFAIFLS